MHTQPSAAPASPRRRTGPGRSLCLALCADAGGSPHRHHSCGGLPCCCLSLSSRPHLHRKHSYFFSKCTLGVQTFSFPRMPLRHIDDTFHFYSAFFCFSSTPKSRAAPLPRGVLPGFSPMPFFGPHVAPILPLGSRPSASATSPRPKSSLSSGSSCRRRRRTPLSAGPHGCLRCRRRWLS